MCFVPYTRPSSPFYIAMISVSLSPFPITAKQVLKRSPVQPKGAYVVDMSSQEVETIQALPFVDLV